MKGDFSRSGFEQHRGYSGVLMQQGRVQLDADWNEQLAIARHAVEARTRDLLGPGGAPAGSAGFTISARAAAPPAPAGSCELGIGTGRLYVDGIMCENAAPATAVLPFEAPPGEAAEPALALAYLDVWERHVTALEDPRLREPALGGPDTATRTRTVWRVALLPVAPPPGDPPPQAAGPRLDWRPAWERFVAGRARRALMAAAVAGGQQANQLYRVEVHDAGRDGSRLKWSRENGSVAFPVAAVELLNGDGPAGVGAPAPLLAVGDEAGSGAAALAAEGGVAVAPEGASALIGLQVLQLERDPHAIVPGDTVELEDALTGLGGDEALLAVVAEVRLLPGAGELLGELVAHVTLRADAAQAAALEGRVAGRAGARLRDELHPVLRRWDRPSDSPRPDPTAGLSLSNARDGETYRLDPGVSVRFDAVADLRPGDYWQLTVRAEQDGQGWAARPPDGPAHHYAPLALLERDATGWRVLGDLRPHFHTAPALSAALAGERQRLDHTNDVVEQLRAAVEQMGAELAYLRRRVEELRGQLEHEYLAEFPVEPGALVAADPGRPGHVERATEGNGALLIGVVAAVDERPGAAGPLYRVVSSGRARCRVRGAVQQGDLLVVSDLPGHARRAGLYVRPGTLLGKALSTWTPEAGEDDLVEVMVMLG